MTATVAAPIPEPPPVTSILRPPSILPHYLHAVWRLRSLPLIRSTERDCAPTNETIRIMNIIFKDIQCRAAVVKLSERRDVIRASTRQLRYSHKRSLLHAPGLQPTRSSTDGQFHRCYQL